MSGSHKKCNTKQRQYEIMVDFMIKHPDLAKGHLNVSNAKSKSNDLWARLSLDLNAAGPPTHDCTKWKKVWADYKNHIKVKCRQNKNSISGTGGGPSKFCSLSQTEEKVVELLSIDKAVKGMHGVLNFGVNNNENSATASSFKSADVLSIRELEDDNIIAEYIDMACDEPISVPSESFLSHTPKGRDYREQTQTKESLLQKQVNNQIKYQEDSVKVMSEINQNLKTSLSILTEVKENLSDVKKYLKRSSDWQERQYKLAKEKFEFKKQVESEKTKRKIQQLDLKKQIFQLKSQKHLLSD